MLFSIHEQIPQINHLFCQKNTLKLFQGIGRGTDSNRLEKGCQQQDPRFTNGNRILLDHSRLALKLTPIPVTMTVDGGTGAADTNIYTQVLPDGLILFLIPVILLKRRSQ